MWLSVPLKEVAPSKPAQIQFKPDQDVWLLTLDQLEVQEVGRYKLEPGDLLFNRTNSTRLWPFFSNSANEGNRC